MRSELRHVLLSLVSSSLPRVSCARLGCNYHPQFDTTSQFSANETWRFDLIFTVTMVSIAMGSLIRVAVTQ